MATGSVDSRDALCHALGRVVAERGWTRTSVDRVAAEAGLASAEFYDHFRSLEHCLVAVHDRMMARLLRNASRAVARRPLALGRAAWEAQLDAAMDATLLFLSVEPALARTCLVEIVAAGPRARARRDRALTSFTAYVEGLRLSHGGPMPPLAAELITLGTTDIVCRRIERGETELLPELMPDLRQLWIDSVARHDRGEPSGDAERAAALAAAAPAG